MKKRYKKWTSEEVEYIEENYSLKSIEYLSKKMGRTKKSIHSKVNRLGLRKTRKIKMSDEYALYKGEELLGIGTLQELADFDGVSLNTMYGHSKASTIKADKGNRKIVVKLEDDEDEEVI